MCDFLVSHYRYKTILTMVTPINFQNFTNRNVTTTLWRFFHILTRWFWDAQPALICSRSKWKYQNNVLYLLKVNNKDTKTTSEVILVSLLLIFEISFIVLVFPLLTLNKYKKVFKEICLKLLIKTTEWRYWRHSGVFIVIFEHILNLFLMFLLLILKK